MGGYFEKHALVQSDGLWAVRRYEYGDDGKFLYIGRNKTHGAGTDTLQWHIWKYTWNDYGPLLIEGPLISSWDNRATLDWE